jgi:hypothetical protein
MIRALATASLLFLLASTSAFAKSVQEFEAMSHHAQAEYTVSFLEKMTFDLREKNPKLAQDIKDYFVRKQADSEMSDGFEDFQAALGAVDDLAKKGQADLSKLQVESVIVYVVKKKFPPSQTQASK